MKFYNSFCIFTNMKIKKRKIYLTLFLGIQILFMRWIESNPSFIEIYYSRGIYPYISSFLRTLFGWMPFSFGDLIIIFLGLYLIYNIYKLISTRFTNMVSKIFGITSFISIIYFLFYFYPLIMCLWVLLQQPSFFQLLLFMFLNQTHQH